MEVLHELDLLIRSRHPLLAVETWEEDRLETALRGVVSRLGLAFYVWTASEGLRRKGRENRVYDSQDPEKALKTIDSMTVEGVWLFKDLHRFLEKPEVARALKDVTSRRGGKRCTIVLAAPKLDLPALLEKVAVRFRLPLPGEAELRGLIHEVVNDLSRPQRVRVELSDVEYRRLLEGLKGLTLFEAERAVTEAVLDDMALTGDDVNTIQRAKRSLLAKGGVLEYVPYRESDPELGGLDGFKAWIAKRQGALSPEAKAFGLPPPKGVVLLGVQGCGKTMAARVVARIWGLPLLKMEAGRLYDMYIGESEKNLDEALTLAEHMAPCVLLVDEIEKGFGAGGGAAADGGLSKRVLGRLLGWLQDRTAPVFVVATCNRVQDLPPELLRKGRFDEIFFVDLPDEGGRREILSLHLKRRGRAPEGFELDRLARASEGFSGAELEQAIVSGLYTAFANSARLDTDGLEAEMRTTQPLSVVRREEVEALRAWARGRTVSAGS